MSNYYCENCYKEAIGRNLDELKQLENELNENEKIVKTIWKIYNGV